MLSRNFTSLEISRPAAVRSTASNLLNFIAAPRFRHAGIDAAIESWHWIIHKKEQRDDDDS
jgi:hypothetical protein